MQSWLQAEWPAPKRVRTCITTREGGINRPPWQSFNLGDHVGDDPEHVAANRARLAAELGCEPVWLKQTHSRLTIKAQPGTVQNADASWTDQPGIACTIMTADCLPVLFCDRAGSRVAAAHAGWRGLAGGVLESTIQALQTPPDQLLVWLGPAIGPASFEVGAEVRDLFVSDIPAAAAAFVPSRNAGRFMADIYHLARLRLQAAGVTAVYGGGLCTVNDPLRFYSYRRDGETGRFASLIWLG
ncbi:peptidoglycan editing factor PgeF [Pseudomonas sp. OIL-1]|uniref:peptidoglycan editing factor PgeF n=1 Tax=Pseudomonas sp. OIL-1 TaxID=2706126 RepID=UPI0013A723F9|nr:peptidoglycan editing factor PgeF [Pseudomonas sp. OIL-1]QIB53002.1 peptidoglycan editing factor PgeF [Pseudomonas sp. OIL-1]